MSDSECPAYLWGKRLGSRHPSQALDSVLLPVLSRGRAGIIGAPEVPRSGSLSMALTTRALPRMDPGSFAHSADAYQGQRCSGLRAITGSGGWGGAQGFEYLLWPARCSVAGIWWDEQVCCGSAQSICDLVRPRRRWPWGWEGVRRWL